MTKIIYMLLFFITFITNNIILSLKFEAKKIKNIKQSKFSLLSLRSLEIDISQNETEIIEENNIPLIKTINDLYTINIYLGEPNQEFSLLLDSGSAILWVTDPECSGCHSKSKFNFEASETFLIGEERVNIRYLSGNIKGRICQDNLYFEKNNNDKIKISKFKFVLVDDSDIKIELNGIFGLSKKSLNSRYNKYSILNQFYEKDIIDDNIFIYDFPRSNFYIGEIPKFLYKQYNFTIKSPSDNNFWTCSDIKVKINNREMTGFMTDKLKLFFDSGTNSIVIPVSYMTSFISLVKNSTAVKNSNCSLSSSNYNNKKIYTLSCDQNINFANDDDIKNNNITIYFSEKKFITFYLKELLDENQNGIKIYFARRPNNDIIVGTPFFEKFTIMFNKDKNRITVFDPSQEITDFAEDDSEKTSVFVKILIGVLIVVILLFSILLIHNMLIRRKNKLNSTQLEANFTVDALYFRQK